MKESNILTKIIVMILVAYTLVVWLNHLEAKSRINKAREIVYYEEPSMSAEALRAYGRHMATRCADQLNEAILQASKTSLAVHTDCFERNKQ